MALTCSGVKSWPSMEATARPPWPSLTLYGTVLSSEETSENLRPMKRLMEKTVFLGLVTAWFLAALPTTRSPSARKPTTDGVVRSPSALTMMVGLPPSKTAIAELVVPRSIPRILLLIGCPSFCRGRIARRLLPRAPARRRDITTSLSFGPILSCIGAPYTPRFRKSKSIHIRFFSVTTNRSTGAWAALPRAAVPDGHNRKPQRHVRTPRVAAPHHSAASELLRYPVGH